MNPARGTPVSATFTTRSPPNAGRLVTAMSKPLMDPMVP
jgi:hypothetical protein